MELLRFGAGREAILPLCNAVCGGVLADKIQDSPPPTYGAEELFLYGPRVTSELCLPVSTDGASGGCHRWNLPENNRGVKGFFRKNLLTGTGACGKREGMATTGAVSGLIPRARDERQVHPPAGLLWWPIIGSCRGLCA